MDGFITTNEQQTGSDQYASQEDCPEAWPTSSAGSKNNGVPIAAWECGECPSPEQGAGHAIGAFKYMFDSTKNNYHLMAREQHDGVWVKDADVGWAAAFGTGYLGGDFSAAITANTLGVRDRDNLALNSSINTLRNIDTTEAQNINYNTLTSLGLTNETSTFSHDFTVSTEVGLSLSVSLNMEDSGPLMAGYGDVGIRTHLAENPIKPIITKGIAEDSPDATHGPEIIFHGQYGIYYFRGNNEKVYGIFIVQTSSKKPLSTVFPIYSGEHSYKFVIDNVQKNIDVLKDFTSGEKYSAESAGYPIPLVSKKVTCREAHFPFTQHSTDDYVDGITITTNSISANNEEIV